jgi:hypothetical protein
MHTFRPIVVGEVGYQIKVFTLIMFDWSQFCRKKLGV